MECVLGYSINSSPEERTEHVERKTVELFSVSAWSFFSPFKYWCTSILK